MSRQIRTPQTERVKYGRLSDTIIKLELQDEAVVEADLEGRFGQLDDQKRKTVNVYRGDRLVLLLPPRALIMRILGTQKWSPKPCRNPGRVAEVILVAYFITAKIV